jgi:hypothetical protein
MHCCQSYQPLELCSLAQLGLSFGQCRQGLKVPTTGANLASFRAVLAEPRQHRIVAWVVLSQPEFVGPFDAKPPLSSSDVFS